jgi:ATP-binding cassette, subfamily B, multidrug efflux pump
MSRVTNEVDTLNQLLSQGLAQLLGSLFSLFGIVIAMLVLDFRLALACFTIIPVMLLMTSFFARWARKAFRATRETVGSVTAGLQEEITGVRQAQASNRTEANIARFMERNAANQAANVQAVGITSAFSPAIDVLSTLAITLVIGYGGYLVYVGSLTVGLLAAFLIYGQQFFRPIRLASQVYTQAQATLAGAERIYNILDEEPEPADPPGTPELDRAKGHIEFENVSFAYEPGRPVLKDVSFTVEPGQTVALLGATGAGKTTIANLILRFYDATSGSVLVDGRDVREVSRRSLRAKIATVLQEPFLFCGTIAENIGYGLGGRREGRDARGDRERRPRCSGPPLYLGPAGRLRHGPWRGWRFFKPGPAPATPRRPRRARRPAHPHPGRGDEQHRHPHRGGSKTLWGNSCPDEPPS